MKNFFSILLISIFALTSSLCGKKGDLLPPLVRFPQTARDLRLTQRADRLILSWKNPTGYEDGSPLSEIEKIEIWVLKEEKGAEKDAGKKDEEKEDVKREEFDQKAGLHLTIEKDRISEYLAPGASASEMRYEYKLSAGDLGLKKFTFGLRVKDRKRYSAFSDLVFLEPLVLSLPPEDVAVSVFQDRIEVNWKTPSRNIDRSSAANLKGFNIYRIEGEKEPRRLNERLIKGEQYDDKQFAFGQTYKYFVRASATGSSPYLESEDSEMAEILAEDTFAPAPPRGLISVAGQGVISLSWDANPEDDLNGYRVWRREEGKEEFIPITREIIKDNTYNDRAVFKGKRYFYAVTALDKARNESGKSEIISERMRERRP